jgi:hypothetical protein
MRISAMQPTYHYSWYLGFITKLHVIIRIGAGNTKIIALFTNLNITSGGTPSNSRAPESNRINPDTFRVRKVEGKAQRN